MRIYFPKIVVLLIVFSLFGAGCSSSQEASSNTHNLPEQNLSSTEAVTRQSHGTAYTLEEAGVPTNYEDRLQTLVYLRGLHTKDGKKYATVDPVRFIDCNQLAALHRSLPKGCQLHPEVGFFIDNDDTVTKTYEMATSSGPFFLNRKDGETSKLLKTMDLPTIEGLLNGTISWSDLGGEYYDPILRQDGVDTAPPTLFYIIEKDGVIEKMIQKYRA